jgi:hypothetical protein
MPGGGGGGALQQRVGTTLALFRAATEYDRRWYKAWHAWALGNYDVIAQYEKVAAEGSVSAAVTAAAVPALLADHVVPAIHGAGPVPDTPPLCERLVRRRESECERQRDVPLCLYVCVCVRGRMRT